MKREPRRQSDRIGIRTCQWKYHPAFVEDLKRAQVDKQTWAAIKRMMIRAADGTARDVSWEYPCHTSTGSVGELKLEIEGEVRYLDANSNEIVESTQISYRVYFNESPLCPEELWAMAAGAKSHHSEYPSTDQQQDIEIATLRAAQMSSTGDELHRL